MKVLTSLILTVLCLQHGQAEFNQRAYSFNAKTTVAHRVASNINSQWILTADLIVQDSDGSKILKLNNVKTIGYHGRPDEIPEDLVPVTVPEASDLLAQPFVAHYQKEYLESLSFMPKDPIWSTNIKKSIASIYQITMNEVSQETYQQAEQNIYGECIVSYKHTETTIHKYFGINDCKNRKAMKPLWHDVPYGTTHGNISRVYSYNPSKEKFSVLDFTSVHSKAQFTYRNKMEETAKYIIAQEHTLKLVDSSFTVNLIDVSSANSKQTPTYQPEQEDIKEQEGERNMDLMKNWLSVYADFNKWLTQDKLEYINEENYNRLEKLHEIMASMNVKTLDIIRDKEYEEDYSLLNIFATLLPTVGTRNSVKFIHHLLKNKSIGQMPGIRILAAYPFHLKSPSVELIKEMEEFLDLDQIADEMVRHVYILSFSNLVGSLNKYIDYDQPNPVYTRIIEQYVEKYYNSYLETNDYDLRMKYILGLMNMGPLASYNLLSIVQNTTESVDCRILATNAIRQNNYLERPEPFQRFWPIVINPGENYELRVAVLSVLLEAPSMELSEIYTIFRYMNQTGDSPVDQHLFSYFYSTMTSNKPEWDTSRARRSAVVDLIVPQLKKPTSMKALNTKNYFIGYQNHIGTGIDAITVANPETNIPRYIHVSLKNYLDEHTRLDSYSVYLRIDKNLDKSVFHSWNEIDYPVKDLLKILQQAKVALRGLRREERLEFGFFCNNRAVFTLFVDESNERKQLADNLFEHFLIFFESTDIATINDISRSNFVSDLGTPISLVVREKQTYSEHHNKTDRISISARYALGTTVDYKTVNPLTNINHGITEVYSNQKLFHMKFKYNKDTATIQWKDEDLYFENLWETNPASYTELGKSSDVHCPNCVAVHFIPSTMPETDKNEIKTSLKTFALSFMNYTNIRKVNEPELNNYLNVLIPNAHYPTVALLWIKYTADYLYYLPRFDIGTTQFILEPATTEPSEFTLQYSYDISRKPKLNTYESYHNYTLSLQQRQLTDEAILYYIKMNVTMNPSEKGQYIKISHDNNGTFKLYIHFKIDYIPSVKDADIFSLKPAEPLTTKTSVYYEKNQESSTIDITSTFEVSEEQQRRIKESDDYKTCRGESNTKHNAPTKSCYLSSLAMYTYDSYAFGVEVKNAPEEYYCSAVHSGKVTPYRFVKDECNRNFNFSAVYSSVSDILTGTMDNKASRTYTINNYFRPKLTAMNRFYDYILHHKYGKDSYCIITPDHVKTFTEQRITYEMATTMVPLIECNNNTRVGLLTKRSHDTVDFKLWIDDDIFKVSKTYDNKNEKGYTVKINDNIVEDNVYNIDFTIEFLAENTLYIQTKRLNLFYNREYVWIKIKSDLVPRLCGMCATGILTAPNIISDSTNL